MERKMLVNDLIYDAQTRTNIERNSYRNSKAMMNDNKDFIRSSDVKIGPKGGRYIIVTETDAKGNSISKKVYLPKH